MRSGSRRIDKGKKKRKLRLPQSKRRLKTKPERQNSMLRRLLPVKLGTLPGLGLSKCGQTPKRLMKKRERCNSRSKKNMKKCSVNKNWLD